jgi:Predicted Zn-dependent protease
MYPYSYGLFADPTFLILLPSIIISFYAQTKIKSTFERYSRVRSGKGYTGSQVARYLLDRSGLNDVSIEMINGNLSDHYDPRHRVLRLSQTVYGSNSVAAIGVAAHETGHAVQDENGYVPLKIRNSLVPVANFGSTASWILILLAFITGVSYLLTFGILLFSAVVLFQIVTLPVEFNASSRAIKLLQSEGILYGDEVDSARKVLSAAALTYVAATLVAISQLLRLLLLNRRRRD